MEYNSAHLVSALDRFNWYIDMELVSLVLIIV